MKDNEAKDEVAEASAEESREEEEEAEVAEENTDEQTGDEKGGGSSPALAATAESLWVAHDRAAPRRSTTRNCRWLHFLAHPRGHRRVQHRGGSDSCLALEERNEGLTRVRVALLLRLVLTARAPRSETATSAKAVMMM